MLSACLSVALQLANYTPADRLVQTDSTISYARDHMFAVRADTDLVERRAATKARVTGAFELRLRSTMGLSTTFLMALGLSMDAFAVSVADGARTRRRSFSHAFQLALTFGVFQALMPLIGWTV